MGRYNALTTSTSGASWANRSLFEIGIGTTTPAPRCGVVYKDGTIALGGTTSNAGYLLNYRAPYVSAMPISGGTTKL